MVCYQVLARFAYQQYKPVLAFIRIKKQEAPAFLVAAAVPFGSPGKLRRWFATEKEAALFVSHLHKVYINRICPSPACSGGQLELFQEVSK
ncbi:hypothetical protein FACS1894110_26700 [Spirochaetia bacterium]|nr:hypothetical protein FACS1894110_26700 [Spirochaetia bacterium]